MNQTYMLNDEPCYDDVGHRIKGRNAISKALNRNRLDYRELDDLMYEVR